MHLRTVGAVVGGIGLALLLLSPPQAAIAQTEEPLTLASTISYDVKGTDEAVHVTWDATITNQDPNSTFRNGQGFYYYAYPIPILDGASNLRATDSSGQNLEIEVVEGDSQLIQSALVNFDRGIFYGETYSFRIAYDLSGTHTRSSIVTPYYGYIAVVGAGDPAVITVNLPSGDLWATSLEGEKCTRDGVTFTCTGSQGPYIAAVAEASQPGRTGSLAFDVRLGEKNVNVKLTYFEGDEATAQHQQALIAAGLPVIEEMFGFRYPGAAALNITQGGQQTVLGYEGLAGCDADSCDIVISPAASDHTLLHELSHMWTGIYDKRWLGEGFAEIIATNVAPRLPEGIFIDDGFERQQPSIDLQLDDWGPASSLIGADENRIELEDAGYNYSLRFLQELQTTFGLQALQAVNRNVATSGSPANSQRFMDLLEEASGRNPDNLFLVWVFPDSFRDVVEQRREARDRLTDLSDRLSAASLPGDVLTPIQALISDWSFDEALASLDKAEAGLDTYAELLPELLSLKGEAADAGLEVPVSIESALANFNFDSAREQLAAAGEALDAYSSAAEKVHSGRSLWTKFGLLGSSPNSSLEDASESFAKGDFARSRSQSEHAQDLIESASSMAFKRLLLVAGLFAVLALAVGIALAVGHLREREFAER